ncbi:MAG: AI-2E family transporter [Gemmataceae bacterium]|nr:AI-2E family transporter [Gemmataceae bacterium]
MKRSAQADPPVMRDQAGSGERYRLMALAAMTGGLVVLCVLLALPFLPAISWGLALTIITWPMHRWIARRIQNPTWAAAVSAGIVTTALLGCLIFVAWQLAYESQNVAANLQNETSDTVREKLTKVPGVGSVVNWMENAGINLEQEAQKLIGGYAQNISSIAQGSLTAAIQLLVAIFIMYAAFRDGNRLTRTARSFLPMTREESERVFERAADSVHANIYATLVTTVIDTAAFTVCFWWVGLPAPLLWATVMFVLSFLPIVGAGMVWVPAAIYLAVSGKMWATALILGVGAVTFVFVDNILYARLAGKRMRMHEALALVAFLGGLAVFGASGMILGPAVVAMTIAFVEVWKGRLARADEEGVDAAAIPMTADEPRTPAESPSPPVPRIDTPGTR